MAFPPGANIYAYKHAYVAQLPKPRPSLSDEDALTSKIVRFATKAQQTNKTLFRFDRDIAQLEAKQEKLMVEFNDLEEKVKLLKCQRQKAVERMQEDNWDEVAKVRRQVGLPVNMVHRQAIEPPKKKKRAPIVVEPESSSSSSGEDTEEEEEEDAEEEEDEEEEEDAEEEEDEEEEEDAEEDEEEDNVVE